MTSQAPISDFSADPKNAYAVVDLERDVCRTGRERHPPLCAATGRSGVDRRSTYRRGQTCEGPLGHGHARPPEDGRAQPGVAGERRQAPAFRSVSPARATIQAWPADAPPRDYDSRNPGVSVVGFTVPIEAGEKLGLKVLLQPGGGAEAGLGKDSGQRYGSLSFQPSSETCRRLGWRSGCRDASAAAVRARAGCGCSTAVILPAGL